MRGRPRAALLVAALLIGSCGTGAEEGRGELLVAAAADLRPAFSELGEIYEQRTGRRVAFAFGSSGRLAQQLTEGAPFDLYASAGDAFVDRVLGAGRGLEETRRTYAYGRIVLWARGDAALPGSLDELSDSRAGTIAIANPDHAPYGLAARQALESAGVWEAVRDRLVYGEDVGDTLRLAATGNADVALVALSLATLADDPAWTLIPDELHEPIEQVLLVTAEDPDGAAAAEAFVGLLVGPEGRQVMGRYGLRVPDGEEPPLWEEGR